jgi:hypothetical protein
MIEGHPVAIATTQTATVTTGPIAPRAPQKPEGASFKEVLHALGNEAKKGEAIVDRAIHSGGREISPGELIALQAGVYRWVEVVDLSSKLVDRVAQSVKTVTQSNGG